MVTLRKSFLVATCFVLISGFLAVSVQADAWNKATLITTTAPIAIPGRVLPAGKYMFKLMDSPADRHIVQIMSDDEANLYQTVLAISDYRPEATDRPSITFYEAPSGSAIPVRSWFYAGERSGVEFVYPKEQAAALAKITGENVPSAELSPAAEPQNQIAALNTEPQVPAVKTPEAPAPEKAQAGEAAATLPKTASPNALFLLIGLGSGIAAYGIRRLRS